MNGIRSWKGCINLFAASLKMVQESPSLYCCDTLANAIGYSCGYRIQLGNFDCLPFINAKGPFAVIRMH